MINLGTVFLSISAALGVHSAPTTDSLKNSVVRLHDVESDRFFCSGTIVSDKYLVTAAHCVAGQELFPGFVVPGPAEVRIKTLSGQTQVVRVAGLDPIMDQALLQGDFKGYAQAELETDTGAVVKALSKNKLLSCGYPLSGALYCERLINGKQSIFVFSFEGHLYPGMSGGPVFDLSTGKVVGTNYAATEDSILIAGTEEEYASCSVQEK